MTDPILGTGGKALSAIKPEQKKDESATKRIDPQPQMASITPNLADEVKLSDETVVELNRAGFDEVKIAQIKQALADGTYPLDPKRIAQGFTDFEKLL